MTLKTDWQGVPVYTVENNELAVSLCPIFGNNLYRIWDKKAERDVLKTPESPKLLAENPGQYGTPLMLPPSRIRDGKFRFNGQDYQLDINTPDGHHIHGFLRNHPWTFNEELSNETMLVSTLNTEAFPDIMRQYPHCLDLEVTYMLENSSLIHRMKVTNRGKVDAPFGYGLHTWFNLDMGPEMWSLHLPVEELWKPGYQLQITRELMPLGEFSLLRDRLPLHGCKFDHVFRIGNNPRLAVISRIGYEIRYSASHPFFHWVIYTHGMTKDVICLEPLTWTPNAPNLDLPAELTGLRGIGPDETLELEVIMEFCR